MKKSSKTNSPGFKKSGSLLPAIIQDAQTHEVLMLGYMNETAYKKTKKEKRVTFFSRSKNRLWTKGESSGHFLQVESIYLDCDRDAILIFANPAGPVCHNGSRSCFDTPRGSSFLFELETIIRERWEAKPAKSYVASLRKKGMKKIAQKVGEEGVETVIAALHENRDALINEASDLFFHLTILLHANKVTLADISRNLSGRHEIKRK